MLAVKARAVQEQVLLGHLRWDTSLQLNLFHHSIVLGDNKALESLENKHLIAVPITFV